jgi:hypothetical protein
MSGKSNVEAEKLKNEKIRFFIKTRRNYIDEATPSDLRSKSTEKMRLLVIGTGGSAIVTLFSE